VRRGWIDTRHPHLSIARQCELASVSRSGWYYEPVVIAPEDDIDIMQAIDEIFTACPMYGSPRITAELKRHGVTVNHKRVERLMRAMGIEALYPKPKTSIGNIQDKRFPYLLKGFAVIRPNQLRALGAGQKVSLRTAEEKLVFILLYECEVKCW